jgi:hypothetical protein
LLTCVHGRGIATGCPLVLYTLQGNLGRLPEHCSGRRREARHVQWLSAFSKTAWMQGGLLLYVATAVLWTSSSSCSLRVQNVLGQACQLCLRRRIWHYRLQVIGCMHCSLSVVKSRAESFSRLRTVVAT